MFLSRCLNTTEYNYWPTKLEIAEVVWVVKKIRHMIEFNLKPFVIVYTDHSAAVFISKQTTLNIINTDKLNLRLIRVSQYLSVFNLELRHKTGKSNVVSNALSRLSQAFTIATLSDQSKGALDALYNEIENWSQTYLSKTSFEPVPVYHATLMKMSDDFKHRLRLGYVKDPHWEKLLIILKPSAEDESVTQAANPFAEDEPATQAASKSSA